MSINSNAANTLALGSGTLVDSNPPPAPRIPERPAAPSAPRPSAAPPELPSSVLPQFAPADVLAQQGGFGGGGGFAGGESGMGGFGGEAPTKPQTEHEMRAERLIDLITNNVDPDSWTDVGGAGSISEYHGLIVVTQTAQTHKKVEPTLEPIPGQPGHQVACLLDTATRKKLWSELRAGVKPETAREDVMEEEVA